MVSPNNSNARRCIQQPRVCPKVIMSKEAHALLTANQRTKSRQFKIALDEAWYQIDKATKTIASAHHKSIHCVQNELYIGHGIQHSKCSKLNAWNVFCWKKNQDIKNCKFCFSFLLCIVPDNLLQVTKAEVHFNSSFMSTRRSTMPFQRTSRKNYLKSTPNGH